MLGVKQVMIPLSDRMGTKLRIEEDLNFASRWKHLLVLICGKENTVICIKSVA